MDRKIASERLRALATNDEKRSTASRLLDVIDDIEAALAAGVPRSAVIEELATLGLEMKPETFYSALKRIRKKRGKPSVPNKAKASTVQESPKNEETEQEPEKDYDEFNNNYASLKYEKINELNEEDKKDIKNLFRKASKLCHPDKVSEEQQEEAERIFKELNNAYKQNDLKKVKDILTNLEKGIFLSKSDTVNEKAKLLVMVNQLRLKRDLMEEELNMLKASETYKTLATIDDWDEYFKTTKEKLSEQLKELEMVNV